MQRSQIQAVFQIAEAVHIDNSFAQVQAVQVETFSLLGQLFQFLYPSFIGIETCFATQFDRVTGCMQVGTQLHVLNIEEPLRYLNLISPSHLGSKKNEQEDHDWHYWLTSCTRLL